MERHLERFLGVRFIATEYQTGKTHGGRIDTLGLDDNNCPVIIQMKELEQYTAFRRMKNFACVRVRQNDLQVWVRLEPSSVELQEGFSRDVTHIGHQGTGNLEIRIQNASDLERAKPLLLRSYQEN